jgi:glycosyltransferase involved in cell wall biosynthesis
MLEFVEAAQQLGARGIKARFVLVGVPNGETSDTVMEEAIVVWAEKGFIEHCGHRTDMPQVFARSSLVVLPLFYLEGLPKALIEAQACG